MKRYHKHAETTRVTLNETCVSQEEKKKKSLELSHERGPLGVCLGPTLRGALTCWWVEAAAGREQQQWDGPLGSTGRPLSENGSRPGHDRTP